MAEIPERFDHDGEVIHYSKEWCVGNRGNFLIQSAVGRDPLSLPEALYVMRALDFYRKAILLDGRD